MLGFRFIKLDASTYGIIYQNGKIWKEGRGLSTWYFAPISTIVAIPLGSSDAPFLFNLSTADFQTVTIQGQITYKIERPEQLSDLLDFTVNAKGKYISDDHEKMHQRLVNEAQTTIASEIEQLTLRKALRCADRLEKNIMDGLIDAPAIKMLGIAPLSVHVLGISPNPEMKRALEAETREALQSEADQAVYDRRKFAVEQEKAIKETELNTEIAIEEKKKQIAAKKMETEIAVEEKRKQIAAKKLDTEITIQEKKKEVDAKKVETQFAQLENDRKLREQRLNTEIAIEEERQTLVDLETVNQRKKADIEVYRLQKIMEEYKQLDWKLLMAMAGKVDSEQIIALAFRDLAQNANKIGTLNITPDLLDTLTKKTAVEA